MKGFDSLSATPENGDFWNIETFYCRLKDEVISQKEWEGCRKLIKVLKMKNLSDFNDIYNIQDVFILGLILEYRWQKIKYETGFDPRCFTSASTLNGAIERIKPKVILTYHRNIEVVDLIESLLRRGYSSVHTRLCFDIEMSTPKSAEYMKQEDDIIEELRKLYGEKNEKTEKKRLNQLLHNVFKQENLNS